MQHEKDTNHRNATTDGRGIPDVREIAVSSSVGRCEIDVQHRFCVQNGRQLQGGSRLFVWYLSDATFDRDYEVLSVEQVEHSTKLQHFVANPEKKYAIVMGNEVKGVKQEVVDASDGCLEIPQLGTKHSMNVSVTAGIVMYKFAEQLLLKE